MSFMKKKTIYIPAEQNCQKQKTVQGQLFLSLFFDILFNFTWSNCKIRQLIWEDGPPKFYLPTEELLYPSPVSFTASSKQPQAHTWLPLVCLQSFDGHLWPRI